MDGSRVILVQLMLEGLSQAGYNPANTTTDTPSDELSEAKCSNDVMGSSNGTTTTSTTLCHVVDAGDDVSVENKKQEIYLSKYLQELGELPFIRKSPCSRTRYGISSSIREARVSSKTSSNYYSPLNYSSML
jgi:hypothetical protein